MDNTLELVFHYNGKVHGAWSALTARVNGKDVGVYDDVVGKVMPIEVHRVNGKDVVIYNDHGH